MIRTSLQSFIPKSVNLWAGDCTTSRNRRMCSARAEWKKNFTEAIGTKVTHFIIETLEASRNGNRILVFLSTLVSRVIIFELFAVLYPLSSLAFVVSLFSLLYHLKLTPPSTMALLALLRITFRLLIHSCFPHPIPPKEASVFSTIKHQ